MLRRIPRVTTGLEPRHAWHHRIQVLLRTDKVAGNYQRLSLHKNIPAPMIEGTHCHLIYNGQTVASKHRKHIRDHRRTKELKTYIKQKTQMSEATFADIDWQSHERSVNTFKDGPHIFLVMFLHGWLPVGKSVANGMRPLRHPFGTDTTIGWNNFLLGRWSKHWTTLQLQYLQRNHIDIKNKNHGLSWSSNIIRLMWDHCYKEWITRNKARHGKDADDKAQRRLEKAHQRIRDL
ncbi:hypothetical protein IV203_010156 [Nitzschia inconspicua]|uniref:Uncharacterized protein n=1 Tax=Nitzschia inconspicua TaxID=303405 RepID=A0A9K3KWE5_9STRA|nr:hypothetical protein IV203_010156 [Nitzschia inconspicua]